MGDDIKSPEHYQLMGDNTIELIARSLTEEEWRGFCLGSVLKYRLRAGKKGSAITCLAKAENFERLYDELKGITK